MDNIIEGQLMELNPIDEEKTTEKFVDRNK
jgi:hypothetical protein